MLEKWGSRMSFFLIDKKGLGCSEPNHAMAGS